MLFKDLVIQLLTVLPDDILWHFFHLQNYIRRRAAREAQAEGVVSGRDEHTNIPLPHVDKDREERRYRPAEFKQTLGKIHVSTLVAPKKAIDVSPPGGGAGGEAERREGSRWKVVLVATEEVRKGCAH